MMNKEIIQTINESSFSRLYRNMKDKTVGILTAYRKINSSKENQRRQSELKNDLRKLGLGFNEIDGYYPEADGENTEIIHERSLVVYSDQNKEWMKKQMVKLGIKYNQDTIIIVDKNNGAYLIGATGANPDFPPYHEENIGQFTASKIEDIYSRVGKDTFVFTRVMPESMTGAIAQKHSSIKFLESDSLKDFEDKLLKRYRTIIGENNMIAKSKIYNKNFVFKLTDKEDYILRGFPKLEIEHNSLQYILEKISQTIKDRNWGYSDTWERFKQWKRDNKIDPLGNIVPAEMPRYDKDKKAFILNCLVYELKEINMNTREMAEFFENEVKKMDEEQGFNKDQVKELVLYAVNDGRLYNQMVMPIVKNLAKKMAKGTFDKDLAVKAFKHLVDEAAKRYTKEFGSTGDNFNQLFPVPDRKQAAIEFLDYYMEDIEDKSEEMKGSKNESLINEEVEDENDELALALQDYLVNNEGDDIEELHIKNSYRNEYETGRGYEAYLVFSSYDEAVAAAEESERNLLDDIGISGINWQYMPYPIEHYLDEDWFRQAWEEMNQGYIEDIIYEGGGRFHDELVERGIDPAKYGYNEETDEFEDEEGAKEAFADSMMADIENDLIGEYKFQLGEESFEYATKEAGADLDEIAADIVETDGPANALASYDGEEIEWEYEGNTYYMYRTN